MRTFRLHAAAAAGVLAAGSASADLITFAAFENASTTPMHGLAFRAELISSGPFVDFIFRNDSLANSVVTAIYFESTPSSAAMLLNGEILHSQGANVEFVMGAAPPNPPGSIATSGGPWRGNLLSLQATAPSSQSGLGPGESVAVRFSLGGNLGDLVQDITADPPAFRIVQHIQGLEDDASLWTVNLGTSIPVPGSGAVLLLATLAIGRGRRRR